MTTGPRRPVRATARRPGEPGGAPAGSPTAVEPDAARDRRPDPRSTRRQLLAGVAGLVGVAGAATVVRAVAAQLGAGRLGVGGLVDASGAPLITESAEAETPAERLAIRPPTLQPAPDGMIAFPVDPAAESYVLDNYGDCRGSGSRAHIGVDIISERGAEVYAVERAKIVRSFENTGTAGWGWALRTEDDVTYRYFHLDALADEFEVGDTVEFGDVIGWVGSTGNFIWDDDGERVEDRDNIHLHFEYWPERARTVDPLPLLDVPDAISVGPPLKSCLSRA
ncbi:MAG: M23 family metallopeptidase [Ilumatobacteraceae bacterium]